jgi:hypothetical protein
VARENSIGGSSKAAPVEVPLAGPSGGVRLALDHRFRSGVVWLTGEASGGAAACYSDTSGPERAPVQQLVEDTQGAQP